MTTYSQINAQLRELGGRGLKPCYIADVKRRHGLATRPAWNRENLDKPKHPCPTSKRALLEQVLRDLGMI